MEPSDASYQWLRDSVSSLEKATDEQSRRLLWVTGEQKLAVSRDGAGRLEIYLAGGAIDAESPAVAAILEHRAWRSDDGTDFSATRVVLPLGEHFDQFAALVCVELVANGVDDDAQGALSAVEPLIVLALRREWVSDQVLLGLVGELALLRSLLASASAPAARTEILASWAGSAPSARDFQIRTTGIEVKATQGSASVHHVQGVHQIELGHSNDDVAETGLYMLSLGLSWIDGDEVGTSLPELVDAILLLVDSDEDRADLVARIKQYGGDAALGYDHARDAGRARYMRRFIHRFERLYDMTDDRLRLLKSADLADLKNVEAGSVAFRVHMADRVRGELNPVHGWREITRCIFQETGLQSDS